jgi:hypothetical protein
MDSGMFQSHVDFKDKNGYSRIAFNKDFTGENRTDDPYGHGSHVSAIAAGNGLISKRRLSRNCAQRKIDQPARFEFAGNRHRVQHACGNGLGDGKQGDVQHSRCQYELGTPAVDSYRDDPICRAVRRWLMPEWLSLLPPETTARTAQVRKFME